MNRLIRPPARWSFATWIVFVPAAAFAIFVLRGMYVTSASRIFLSVVLLPLSAWCLIEWMERYATKIPWWWTLSVIALHVVFVSRGPPLLVFWCPIQCLALSVFISTVWKDYREVSCRRWGVVAWLCVLAWIGLLVTLQMPTDDPHTPRRMFEDRGCRRIGYPLPFRWLVSEDEDGSATAILNKVSSRAWCTNPVLWCLSSYCIGVLAQRRQTIAGLFGLVALAACAVLFATNEQVRDTSRSLVGWNIDQHLVARITVTLTPAIGLLIAMTATRLRHRFGGNQRPRAAESAART